jgi:sucrose-6-phosphate hydrolase SacC (GH32 family)
VKLAYSDRYAWDFWYYFDENKGIFHVFYLNADRSLVPENRHHFASRVGYAITKDFSTIERVNDSVFAASEEGWDNTSIWTGDVVRVRKGYLLFYTSRDRGAGDGLTQNIGMAFSQNLVDWQRIPNLRIAPDPTFYEASTVTGDTGVHAWRDPFVFNLDAETYMILAAKAKKHPLGRKGTVALLKAIDRSLLVWKALPPLYSPGWYGELEVPQLYRETDSRLKLVFSVPGSLDLAPNTRRAGGFQMVGVSQPQVSGTRPLAASNPAVLLPYSSGIYACRVIPELNGEIVGFNIEAGGFRRSGVTIDLHSMNRDFSWCEYYP